MATSFDKFVNNTYATLASTHATSATSLVLNSGQGAQFGSTFPMLVTAITAASYRTTAEVLTIFTVTGRTTDTLTVSATPAEGTSDPGYSAGAIVEMRFTAGEANLISTAVNALETTPSISGNLTLVATTSSATGVIMKGANAFAHDFTAASTDGNNVFVGKQAGNFTMAFSSSSGDASYNVAIGYQSLAGLTNGNSNVAVGANSLQSATTGSRNMAFGYQSMNALVTGSDCVAIGYDASQNSVGTNNIAIGSYASRAASGSTGSTNLAIGYAALYAVTSGSYSVAIGANSLTALTTGGVNTAIGLNAGQTANGSNCLFIGAYSGAYETASNIVILDTIDRTNLAGGKAGAILYAVTNATPASQTVVFNAVLTAPIAGPYVVKSGAYTTTALNRIITVTNAGGTYALTLPAASGMVAGFELTIKKTDANTNQITVTPSGSDKIDGASTFALAAQYKYIHLCCDGVANWYNIGSN